MVHPLRRPHAPASSLSLRPASRRVKASHIGDGFDVRDETGDIPAAAAGGFNGHWHAGRAQRPRSVSVGGEYQISQLRLDTDWYASTPHEPEHLYPLLRQAEF
jgi:hypothetical protein